MAKECTTSSRTGGGADDAGAARTQTQRPSCAATATRSLAGYEQMVFAAAELLDLSVIDGDRSIRDIMHEKTTAYRSVRARLNR